MKGFVLGALFGVAIVFLSFFLLNNGSITSNVINSNQIQEVQKNKVPIQNEVKSDVAIKESNVVSVQNASEEKIEVVVEESNIQNFETFKTYNMEKNSKEVYLMYRYDAEEKENMPMIKMNYPMNDLSELIKYIRESQIEIITMSSNVEVEIGTQIRRSAGVSVISKIGDGVRRNT
jgi:hypothetical protein